jgi:hypothetical protein
MTPLSNSQPGSNFVDPLNGINNYGNTPGPTDEIDTIQEYLLRSAYEATADLWQLEDELKWGLMKVVSLITSRAFVLIYGLIGQKNLAAGIKYGLLFGVGVGIGMGYGSYAVQDIPYFLGTVVKAVAAGLVTAAIVKS